MLIHSPHAHSHTHMYASTHTNTQSHSHTHTCMYAFTDIHSHTYTHVHIHTHSHSHTHTRMHTYTHIHTCTHSHIQTHSHSHAHMHTFTHIHVCMHSHTYTHIHIHTKPLTLLTLLSNLKCPRVSVALLTFVPCSLFSSKQKRISPQGAPQPVSHLLPPPPCHHWRVSRPYLPSCSAQLFTSLSSLLGCTQTWSDQSHCGCFFLLPALRWSPKIHAKRRQITGITVAGRKVLPFPAGEPHWPGLSTAKWTGQTSV